MIITIDLEKEAIQTAYAEDRGISLSTLSHQIKRGKVSVRDIPELNLKLVKLDTPLKKQYSGPMLHNYTTEELSNYFLDLLYKHASEEHDLKGQIKHLDAKLKIISIELGVEREEAQLLREELLELKKFNLDSINENNKLKDELRKLASEKFQLSTLLTEATDKITVLEKESFEKEVKISELTSKIETQQEIHGIMSILKESFFKRNSFHPFANNKAPFSKGKK